MSSKDAPEPEPEGEDELAIPTQAELDDEQLDVFFPAGPPTGQEILSVIEGQQKQLNAAKTQLETAVEEQKQMVSKEKLKHDFSCPITRAPMCNPVMASDGHAYEQSAIEKWFKNHNTSPMTGAVLHNKTLTPIHTLKSAIDSTALPQDENELEPQPEEELLLQAVLTAVEQL